MKNQDYKVWPMLRRMLRIMKEEIPVQIPRTIIYTIVAGLYPFFEVMLPKLGIGTIEKYGDNAVEPLIKIMAIYCIVAGLFAFFYHYINQIIAATNMRARLRALKELSRKMQIIEYRYHEDSGFLEKYDKAFNSCNYNSNGVEGVYNKMFYFPAKIVTIIGMMIMVCFLNPLLAIPLVLHVVATVWAGNRSHDYRYSKKEELAKAERKWTYYKKTTNDFAFGKDIRIFNLRDRILHNYHSELNAYTSLQQRIVKREWLFGLAGIATLLLTNAAMYGMLIYYSYKGMPISSFTMYVALINSLMSRMVEAGEDMTFIRSQGQYVNDYFKFLDAPLVEEGDYDLCPQEVEIEFDHMSFKYPNTDKYIYKDFSFKIKKGERLAIVGINGAGKTTLVKLMCGLYQPTEGHIYINGKDISDYKKSTLFDIYGTVFQDFSILAFTIAENVAGTAENVDRDRVMQVLESVGLGKKIESLPKGIDSMMLKIIDEDGIDLSGGERQKLAIARALYKDAPMVIMDEPTAALDALAEADIYENFSALVEGKTAVYISHRLASTKFCDKIALFDGEGVKEYGTHEELMELQGEYYDMFVIQGKYYQEQEETVA